MPFVKSLLRRMRREISTILGLALLLSFGDAAHICHHGVLAMPTKEAASNVTSAPNTDDANAMTSDNDDAYVTVPSNSDDDDDNDDNDAHEQDHRGRFSFPAEIKEMLISGTGLLKF